MEIIYLVQKLNAPLFAFFMKSLNYLDRQDFLFILIPFTWIFLGRKQGLRFFYFLLFNGATNLVLKRIFAHPRPYVFDPSIALVNVSGFSLPSGGAQTSFLLALLLIYNWKNPLKWLIAPIYTLCVSFSRIYLGVHFPHDVLAGWGVAIILFGVYVYLVPKIGALFKSFSISKLASLNTGVFLLLSLSTYPSDLMRLFSAAAGISLGCALSYSFKIDPLKRSSLFSKLIDLSTTILGLFFLYYYTEKINLGSSKLGMILQAFSLGFWISFLALYVTFKAFPIKKDLSVS